MDVNPNLDIRIKTDSDAGTITITWAPNLLVCFTESWTFGWFEDLFIMMWNATAKIWRCSEVFFSLVDVK